jgi:hypothetical protein
MPNDVGAILPKQLGKGTLIGGSFNKIAIQATRKLLRQGERKLLHMSVPPFRPHKSPKTIHNTKVTYFWLI